MEKVVDGVGLRALKQARGIKNQGLDLLTSLIGHAPTAGHHAQLIGQAHPLRQALVRDCLCANGFKHASQRWQQLRVGVTAQQHATFDHRLAALEALQRQRLRQAQHGGDAGT